MLGDRARWSKRPSISAYGVLDVEPADGAQRPRSPDHDLVEKPKPEDAPSNLAIIGRYILTPDIFEILAETPHRHRRRNPVDRRPEALLRQRRSTATASKASATTPATSSGFLKATVEFALKRPELNDQFRYYLKNLESDRALRK